MDERWISDTLNAGSLHGCMQDTRYFKTLEHYTDACRISDTLNAGALHGCMQDIRYFKRWSITWMNAGYPIL